MSYLWACYPQRICAYDSPESLFGDSFSSSDLMSMSHGLWAGSSRLVLIVVACGPTVDWLVALGLWIDS